MLFTDKQFGFLRGRSTTLQLLQILDKWTECLEHGGQVDIIYTDLEKAFDKIPHRRLISKLHSYCIHNNIVEWLEAFLSNRNQRVRIGNTFSNWAAVISSDDNTLHGSGQRVKNASEGVAQAAGPVHNHVVGTRDYIGRRLRSI